MTAEIFKFGELILVFGAVFGFLFWQLRSINKTIDERKRREAAEASETRTEES